jgi:L-fuconolactonase
VKKIDSHQHFWLYEPAEYPWIQQDWPIRRTFLPPDLAPLLRNGGFDGCVAVQARQSLRETEWLLSLADEYPFIAGVVGWVDLRAKELKDQLAHFVNNPKLVGVRHVVQDETDDNFVLRNDFLRGIAALKDFGLAYDLLVFPRQLPASIELVRRFPAQRFVLDHLAKPQIKDGTVEPWAAEIRELARLPNCFCKISGMVTEARWRHWTAEDFQPYLEIVWDSFGPDRLMIGSDWPVCLLSADYPDTMGLVRAFLNQFSTADQEKVMGGNAVRFYRLPIEC